MRKYKEYKDSDVAWLGEIPISWKIKRVKDEIRKIGSGVTPKGGSEVYVTSGITFLRSQNVYDDGLRIDDVSFINIETHNKMKNSQIKPFDILINITGASIGRTCVVPNSLKTGNINQHIIFLRFNTNIVPYLSNYFKSTSVKEYINMIQAGTSKEALNMGQTLSIPILLPPNNEQQAIANYLDAKTQAIDKKLSLLDQKIETYKKLKRTLINQTITKGLRSLSEVEMKDSGISWIGQIPQHWEVKRLKDVCKSMSSGATPTSGNLSYYEGGTINWLNTGDLNDGIINSTQKKLNNSVFDDYPNLKIQKKGTLVIAMYGATIGKIGLLDIDSTTNQACCCLNFKNDNFNKFHFYQLLNIKQYIISLSVGGTQPNVSQGILSFIEMVVPPKSEQEEIAKYLDHKTATIDAIVSNIGKQIDTLKQLRKTLINDVVTGKIKVYDD